MLIPILVFIHFFFLSKKMPLKKVQKMYTGQTSIFTLTCNLYNILYNILFYNYFVHDHKLISVVHFTQKD